MFLLDTHTLLWAIFQTDKLSHKVVTILSEEDEIYVSIASLWEIAIKKSIGKLKLNVSIEDLAKICRENAITILPIDIMDVAELPDLPRVHGDPFDRMLIVSARNRKMTLVTKDNIIPRYDVKTLW